MSAALTTIASATSTDVPGIYAFGGFLALVVGIVSFLAISGLALSMTIGAAKSPGSMAITGVAGVLSVIIGIGLYMTLSTKHPDMSVLAATMDPERFAQLSLSEKQAMLLDICPGGLWDRLGAVIGLIVGVISLLSLGGVAVVMTIGAFVPSKSPITSWPMAEEQTFFGYDRRNATSQSRAWVFAVVSGVLVFVFVFGVYQGVAPDERDLSKDMNISNITKKSKVEAPKPTPPKAAAPAPEAAPTP
jgi:hypothetical protein